MTRQHLWTDKINQNKLRFTGHILRLPEGTPARQALQIALKPVTRPRGQQKTTWIQSTNTLLQSVGLDNLGTNKLQESADDKKTWKQKTDEVLHGRCALDSALLLLLLSTPLHQRAASRVQHPNYVAANSLSPQVARKGSTLSGFVQRSRLEREVGRDLHSNKWEEV